MTDEELIELLAARGMGWTLYNVSAHRPGSRELPHVWKWPRAGGARFMVYDGKGNREWNPLAVPDDRDELLVALHRKGITLPSDAMFDIRSICLAAATALAAPPPAEPQPPIPGSDGA